MRKLYELVCPHYCMGCGMLGEVLCGRCKNYNVNKDLNACLNCGKATNAGHCEACRLPYDRGYAVGKRDGVFERCVNEFKYKSVRALYAPLADMLAATLPYLPDETLVVPVPTNHRHVRARGLDHTAMLARELARLRGWRYEKVVERVKDSVQVGADMETRRRQAGEAYALASRWVMPSLNDGVAELRVAEDVSRPMVVVDDVWTTGSTMKAVCELLRETGAQDITAIVLTRA